MESFDIAPGWAFPCFFDGFFAMGAVMWPLDIDPCDIDPELIAPPGIGPDDIDPEPIAPLCMEPDWLPDPDVMEPLPWLCE